MRWLKVADAAQEWAGNISPKTIYTAIRAGQWKAARIGAGGTCFSARCDQLRVGSGGRGWNRTTDPSRVKRMLYR